MSGKSVQIIKCRDDSEPAFLEEDSDEVGHFRLRDGDARSWLGEDGSIGPDRLRTRIEPWLTSIVQAEHLNLLVGSGLTQAVHLEAADKPLPGMSKCEFGIYAKEIDEAARLAAQRASRASGNIEDQIRVANDLLRGMEILNLGEAALADDITRLNEELSSNLEKFVAGLLEGERGALTAEETKRTAAFNLLVSFLMSFASRIGTRDRLQIFTTNYDRFIEAGADLAGLHLIDRFVGKLAPLFRSSRLDIDLHYNPPGIRGEPRFVEGVARFTKLHGAIDWVDTGDSIVRVGMPFGADSVAPYMPTMRGGERSGGRQLMIYPNASKDRETAAYPYVELFRDFASAICRPHGALVCYGYGFGDEHINRVIEDMLTIPSTHLVIISWDDPLNRIMDLYERVGRTAQITLLVGSHFGSLRQLVTHYLPKPAIDRATSRMADLLKARWGARQEAPSPPETGASGPVP